MLEDTCTHDFELKEELVFPNDDGTKIITHKTFKCKLCRLVAEEITENDNPCTHNDWEATGASWCSMNGDVRRKQFKCIGCGYKKLIEEPNKCNHKWHEFSRRYDSSRKDIVLSFKCSECNGYSIEKPRIHDEHEHVMSDWEFKYHDDIYDTDTYARECTKGCGYTEAIDEPTLRELQKNGFFDFGYGEIKTV